MTRRLVLEAKGNDMNDNTSKMAARYIARAFADYRMMQGVAYSTETAEGFMAYRSALNALIDAQNISGVEMIDPAELIESIRWCTRMAEKIDA
jgi:hypothetical protein